MVRNLVPLLEILACLYCIAGTYGKKVRCNIYVVVFVIAEMLLLCIFRSIGNLIPLETG